MPSEKRERQRANRQRKQERLRRAEKRRKVYRRGLAVVVVAGLVVGIYYAATSLGSSSKKTTKPLTPQAAALKADKAAGCPGTANAPVHKRTWTTAPPMTVNPAFTYTATVKTDVGSFTIALDAKNAPKTVNNFLFLASSQYYNCVAFHRVIPGFMDQVGDPTGTGKGGPGYKFADENIPTNGYTAGEVAMANSGPNTNGSQFFVLVGSYSTDNYSLFGHVTSGMNVVQKINKDGTASGTPKVYHRILSVSVGSTAPGVTTTSSTSTTVHRTTTTSSTSTTAHRTTTTTTTTTTKGH